MDPYFRKTMPWMTFVGETRIQGWGFRRPKTPWGAPRGFAAQGYTGSEDTFSATPMHAVGHDGMKSVTLYAWEKGRPTE